jgi:hypothetical protein
MSKIAKIHLFTDKKGPLFEEYQYYIITTKNGPNIDITDIFRC